MRINRFLIVGILVFIVPTLFLSFASAYTKLCLLDCQGTPIDNPRYICQLGSANRCGDSGYCEVCVTNLGYPTAPYKCAGQVCSFLDDNGTIDSEAPNLSVNSPEQEEVYTSRSVLLDMNINERSDLYYYDNIYGRGRWTRVCSDCYSYSGARSFKEGLNDITFIAVDAVGNQANLTREFFVDSKKPRIKRSEPRRGFASGLFEVQFQEDNPVELILHYGTPNPGMRQAEVDLESCVEDRGRRNCEIEVELEDFDGEEIVYWFGLEDIAGNYDESKPVELKVDTTFPVLNNPLSFWSQGEGRYARYIYFNFNITEENFDEVSYIDWSETRPRWKRLCSRLRDGKCEVRKTFRRGEHNLDIQITDEAGNAVGFPMSFDADY